MDGIDDFRVLFAGFSDERTFTDFFYRSGKGDFIKIANGFRKELSIRIDALQKFFYSHCYISKNVVNEEFVDYWIERLFSLSYNIKELYAEFEKGLSELEVADRDYMLLDGTQLRLSFTDWYVLISCLGTSERLFDQMIDGVVKSFPKNIVRYDEKQLAIRQVKGLDSQRAKDEEARVIATSEAYKIIDKNKRLTFEMLENWSERRRDISLTQFYESLVRERLVSRDQISILKCLFGHTRMEAKLNWIGSIISLRLLIAELAKRNVVALRGSVKVCVEYITIDGKPINEKSFHGNMKPGKEVKDQVKRLLDKPFPRRNI